MSDLSWIAFWLAWAIGGLVFFMRLFRVLPDEPPAHWTLMHVIALLAASGPVIWAAVLAVLIWDEE